MRRKMVFVFIMLGIFMGIVKAETVKIRLGNKGIPIPAIVFSREARFYLEIEIDGKIQNHRQRIDIARQVSYTKPIGNKSYMISGAVAFFDLPQCPDGWSELTEARGRYIVGLVAGGETGAIVGTALSDQENRPIGKHFHTVNYVSHSHEYVVEAPCEGNVPGNYFGYYSWWAQTPTSQTGITILSEGSVQGTNAPYIQFRLCIRN